MMKIYVFKPKKMLLLTGDTARFILDSDRREIEVPFNLGKYQLKIHVGRKGAKLPDGTVIGEDALKWMASDPWGIYAVESDKVYKLAWYSGRMYLKLRAVKSYTAPTLELDGIHMHRIEGTTPWRDSREKVFALGVKRGDKVLDVCTGLGYTAIHALRMHASKIVTIEKHLEVLEMAEYNPWSWELADKRIAIVLEDAFTAVKSLEGSYFEKVIHDPPRFSRAGELYSLEFYSELYRVLKPGGKLFHYTGAPRRVRGIDILGGVSKRLKLAGFKVRIRRDLMGILAEKPR